MKITVTKILEANGHRVTHQAERDVPEPELGFGFAGFESEEARQAKENALTTQIASALFASLP